MIETSYHTNVCHRCGIETHAGYITRNITFLSRPVRLEPPSYSRRQRFRDLVRSIFGLDSGPKAADPVWGYLKNGAPFESVAEVFQALKNSNLKHKHYGCMHLFTKIFVPDYRPPQVTSTELEVYLNELGVRFQNTLRAWNLSRLSESFFSYSWLIEKYLRLMKLHVFLPYVKILQCGKRRERYEKNTSCLTEKLMKCSSR